MTIGQAVSCSYITRMACAGFLSARFRPIANPSGLNKLSVQQPHDDVVLPRAVDKGRFALAAFFNEAALAIASDSAGIARQHT